jgi:hypothetical protein
MRKPESSWEPGRVAWVAVASQVVHSWLLRALKVHGRISLCHDARREMTDEIRSPMPGGGE